MNILVTGPKGFVGANIMKHFPNAVGAPSLRNATEDQVKRLFDEVQPDVIIHTAAVSDMGDCERDPEGSYAANVELPVLLARCNPGAKLVAFSSDQVYNGSKELGPFDESMVCPANTYAREKVEMENRLLDLDPNVVLLRAEWMYSYLSYKDNYFLLNLNATGPIRSSRKEYRGVTYIREVAENMDAVIRLPGGAYNFGSETDRTIYDVTKAFLDMTGMENELIDGKGGPNLWMNCAKARAHGVDFSPVVEGLRKCWIDMQSL